MGSHHLFMYVSQMKGSCTAFYSHGLLS